MKLVMNPIDSQLDLVNSVDGFITGVVADAPLSGSGTAASHLTVDLSSKQSASAILTALAGLSWSTGTPFIKMTGASAFSLDTNTYLTAESDTLQSVMTRGSTTATQLTSTLATGTSPFAVTSTTVNTNLNADLWDGNQFATYLDQAVLTTSTPTFGGLTLNGLETYNTGQAITAGSYQMGRDNDATNQLHFQVPTGASMEWSINDVRVLSIYSAGQLYHTPPTMTDGVTAGFFSATFPSVITANRIGYSYSITSAGSSSFVQTAFQVTMNAGYTGNTTNRVVNVFQGASGTGTNLWGAVANIACIFGVFNSTVGHNIGGYSYASGGSYNIGHMCRAFTASNNGTNVGVEGVGVNTGTNGIQVGGFFHTNVLTPGTALASAVVIMDNETSTNPILLCRDNGVNCFTIADGGDVSITNNLHLVDNMVTYFGTGNDMTVYYDGTNGNIDTDLVAASDLTIDCGTAKTVVLEVPVYNDANVGSLVLVTGGTLPGVVDLLDNTGTATGIYFRGFAVGEQGSGSIEIPHDYKEGTDLIFHVHWVGNDAPTGTDNVKWQVKYSITREEVTTPATTTDSAETAYDTQYEWKRTDVETIVGANLKIGDQINFSFSRIASVGDAYAGEALVATLGVHYQTDTLGSRQITTK